MPKDHSDKRRAALWLLRKGYLGMGDIAKALKTTRQLVRYWAESSGINYRATRETFIRRCVERAKKNGGQ